MIAKGLFYENEYSSYYFGDRKKEEVDLFSRFNSLADGTNQERKSSRSLFFPG